MTPALFWRLGFFGNGWLMCVAALGLLGDEAEAQYDSVPAWMKVALWIAAIPVELGRFLKSLEMLGLL